MDNLTVLPPNLLRCDEDVKKMCHWDKDVDPLKCREMRRYVEGFKDDKYLHILVFDDTQKIMPSSPLNKRNIHTIGTTDL